MQYYSTSYCGCNTVIPEAGASGGRARRISATVAGMGIRNVCMPDISMYDMPFRWTMMTTGAGNEQ
jgi:hypothetical protein